MNSTDVKKIFLALFIIGLTITSCNDDETTTSNPETAENAANRQPLGTSAAELLSDDFFTSLRVEIGYVEGFRPTQESIDRLIPFLEERLNKPDGITLKETVVVSEETGPYDINEIVAIEDASRTVYNNGDELGVWLFFSDQNSESDMGNSVVLGSAYRNTSMVIFEKTFIDLANNSVTPINRTQIETSTMRHEFGHVFGLVNIGTPLTSDHEDPDNIRHCTVEECLMYFQTVTNVFNNSNVDTLPVFDPLCIADLQANGGK